MKRTLYLLLCIVVSLSFSACQKEAVEEATSRPFIQQGDYLYEGTTLDSGEIIFYIESVDGNPLKSFLCNLQIFINGEEHDYGGGFYRNIPTNKFVLIFNTYSPAGPPTKFDNYTFNITSFTPEEDYGFGPIHYNLEIIDDYMTEDGVTATILNNSNINCDHFFASVIYRDSNGIPLSIASYHGSNYKILANEKKQILFDFTGFGINVNFSEIDSYEIIITMAYEEYDYDTYMAKMPNF